MSVFENSETKIQYGYIAHLNDGRGYTAGRSGFTTGTGDLLLVVEDYLSKTHDPEFEALLPVLKSRAQDESDSIAGLENLPRLWRSRASTALFRTSQDVICNQLYKAPALRIFAELGLHSALAYLVLYDTVIQHGEGSVEDDDYQDSLQGILSRVGDGWHTEDAFLDSFLRLRKADLLHPYNHETQAEWRKSVDRVNALRRLFIAKNHHLDQAFVLHVWGENFPIL